ncbi:hypothetical protein [Pyramidobacter piscolens]|uniref:hypothetical protein n=1 Tax=Pyramidobacter piscolens TaxID=638849 RepID=UPI003AB77050
MALLEGYRWRRDEEALFWGNFFLPITNYVMDKSHRHGSLPDFVGHLLSPATKDKMERERREVKEADAAYLRRTFGLDGKEAN